MPCRITLPQSAQIIDLLGRCQGCLTAGYHSEMRKVARAITLTILMLPTFYIMVFDTQVSSEQTVKQQAHILQGVAQMVMNIETGNVEPQAKAYSDVSGKILCLQIICRQAKRC